MKNKNGLGPDSVPEGITFKMSLVDMIPVLFFSASACLIALRFKSLLFTLGAVLIALSGFGKVLWKFIVSGAKKNVWPLYVQMHYVMPLGFVLQVAAVAFNWSEIPWASIFAQMLCLPQLAFFASGCAGMVCMILFAVFLDSSSARANWLEQGVNGLAQALFFAGILLM